MHIFSFAYLRFLETSRAGVLVQAWSAGGACSCTEQSSSNVSSQIHTFSLACRRFLERECRFRLGPLQCCLSCDTSRGLLPTTPEPAIPLEEFAFFCTGDDSANPCVFTSTHEVAESLQVQKMRTPRAGAPVQAWTPPLPQLCLSCDTSRGLPRTGPEAALPLETLAFFASAMIRQPHVYSLPHMKVTSRSKCNKMRTCRAGVQVPAWTPPLPLFCLRCDTSRGLPRIGPEPALPHETFAFFCTCDDSASSRVFITAH